MMEEVFRDEIVGNVTVDKVNKYLIEMVEKDVLEFCRLIVDIYDLDDSFDTVGAVLSADVWNDMADMANWIISLLKKWTIESLWKLRRILWDLIELAEV